MAINKITYQLRPPEVVAVLWDRPNDTAEVAAWCGGRVNVSTGTMEIPDRIDQDSGYVAKMPCYIVHVNGRYVPIGVAEFESNYVEKIG